MSTRCNTTLNPECAHHLRYNANTSSTYRPGPYDTLAHFTYPLGPELDGVLSYDTLSLGSGIHVPDLPFVELKSEQGYGHPYDAVLGLAPGLERILDGVQTPKLPSPFKHMVDTGVLKSNIFSLLLPLDEHDTGDLSFGVVHHDLYEGELQSHPLVPANATNGSAKWQIAAPDFSLRDRNGKTLSSHSLKGYKALIDLTLGDSILLPMAAAEDFLSALNVTEVPGCEFIQEVPCDKVQDMPDIVVNFDGQEIAIRPELYIKEVGSFPFCPTRPMCMPFIEGLDPRHELVLGNKTIILGEAFLKSVYSVFDWDKREISCECLLRC